MTVCVAAIAAKSKAIVMIADKAITYGTERPMQADVGIKKMLPIGGTGWHALIGGDPSFAREVIDTALENIKGTKTTLQNTTIPSTARGMMHCIRDAYQKVRKQMASDLILAPCLLNETTLNSVPEQYAIELRGEMAALKVQCSLLVCGFDLSGQPHIFSVSPPGLATNHDIPGFHAVGIGRDMAIGRLYSFETESEESLDNALYEVFDAKATAELIQGVGYEWDCSVLIANGKPREISKSARRAVEGLFEEATASPYHAKWGSKFKKIPEWKKTLKDFTDNILKPRSNPPRAKHKKPPH